MNYQVKDDKLIFNCGCSFAVAGPPQGKSKLPQLKVSFDLHDVNNNINFSCKETWKLLGKGWTKGVFQLESNLGRTWCKQLRPESIDHMAALGSILRPGAMQAKDENRVSITQHYCRRKNYEEDIPEYHPVVDKVLEDTYNCLVFQEQSMKLATEVAKFTLQEADMLRKAIGKKLPEEMAKVRKLFLEKAKDAAIVSEEQAEEIFNQIEKSQRYQFNKSHACAYGITGYVCAFIKTHFPVAFYKCWLARANEKMNPHEEIAELVNEAKIASDVKILPPDIRFVREEVHTDGENIYFGLMDVKGVGEAQFKKLKTALEESEISGEVFSRIDWLSFLMYVLTKVSSTVVENLIRVGALSFFNIPRAQMLEDYDIYSSFTKPKETEFIFAAATRSDLPPEDYPYTIVGCLKYLLKYKGYHDKRREKFLRAQLERTEKPLYSKEDTVNYLVNSEEELLGVSLTCHITDELESKETHSCKDIAEGYKGYAVLKVRIDRVSRTTCKNGDQAGQTMAFISASDSSCQLENCVVFPGSYKENKGLISAGHLVYISGRATSQGSFSVEKVYE